MAEVIERLDVTHNFVTIDSPIKFYIQMNDDTKHRVLKSAQAIQIDCRKLLTRKDMPNIPAWALFIVYDDSLLAEGEQVLWYAHDVDFAGSTDSVNGVLVDVDLSALYAELSANNDSIISSIETSVGGVLSNFFSNSFWLKFFSDSVSFKSFLFNKYGNYGYLRFFCDSFFYSTSVVRVFARKCFVQIHFSENSFSMNLRGDLKWKNGPVDGSISYYQELYYYEDFSTGGSDICFPDVFDNLILSLS